MNEIPFKCIIGADLIVKNWIIIDLKMKYFYFGNKRNNYFQIYFTEEEEPKLTIDNCQQSDVPDRH